MEQIRREIQAELTNRIIPFWKGLRDGSQGGYIGRVDYDLSRHPEADKGCILNSRILWFFSEAFRFLGDANLKAEALGFLNAWQRTGEAKYRDALVSQWRYIRDHMTDKRPGSEWFWYVNEDGAPNADPWKCPCHNGPMCLEALRRLAD